MSVIENLNKIEQHIEKIRKINANVSNSGKFSSLELDLVKQHLRELYELYDELSVVKPTNHMVNEVVQEEIKEEIKAEPKQEEIIVAKEDDLITNEELENVTPESDNDTAADIILESNIELSTSKNIEVKKPEEKEKEASINLFEKKQIQPEEIVENTNDRVTKPIKQLIGLNDKFTFIKVLFGNSVSKYDEVIVKIDGMNSKKEAMNYFETHVWNGKEIEEKEELIERVEAILDAKFNS